MTTAYDPEQLHVFGPRDTFVHEALPGFAFDLEALFAEVDR